MATYYIDYENVHNAGLKGLEQLSAQDYVYIFYSENASTFSVESMKLALQSVCGVEFVQAIVGAPNALDFQIVTMVFATPYEDDYHFIISKDRGYDAAIKMGQKCGRENVDRYPDILTAFKNYRLIKAKEEEETDASSVAVAQVADNQDDSPERLDSNNMTRIKKIIQKKCGITVSDENLEVAYDGLVVCTTKMQLYNFFRAKLGNSAGNKLYKLMGDNYYELKEVV